MENIGVVLGDFGVQALGVVLVLSVVVFVHEWGHYWVARRAGVRIEAFSIGFGPEVYGFYDKAGTRWKISALPFGGYVKMFGDADAASTPGSDLPTMTAEEKAVSFHHKPLAVRAAVVAAGPLINFLFAIVALTVLYATAGQSYTPPEIGSVQPGGAAERAGLQPGDVVRSINGDTIKRFEEIRLAVVMNPGVSLPMEVERNGRRIELTAVPETLETADGSGASHRVGRLGVASGKVEHVVHDPLTAAWEALREISGIVTGTFTALGQMIEGSRGAEELGGPLRIAQMSGEAAKSGAYTLIWFTAFMSVNLGLINLMPVPVLDGGHLMFYLIEAVRGRPLEPRLQEYGFRIGLALVLSLMVFATWNDLLWFRVVDFFMRLIS